MHSCHLARMHLQMCINALIIASMNTQTYEHIEQSAAEVGLTVKELYKRAKIALSTRTRWKNKTTEGTNTKTLSRLEKVVEREKKRLESGTHKRSPELKN